MRYDPKDADKVVFPKGWYNAELIRATDETSKKKNPMLHIFAKVFSPNGGHVTVDDYLVAGVQIHMDRLKRLSAVLGVPFQDGEIDPASVVGDCKVYITIQESPEFGDKNRIERYASADANVEEAVPAGVPTGDDIPFSLWPALFAASMGAFA